MDERRAHVVIFILIVSHYLWIPEYVTLKRAVDTTDFRTVFQAASPSR
jgi:hypothetical protein